MLISRRYGALGQSHAKVGLLDLTSSTRQIGHASQVPCNYPSHVAAAIVWRCLAGSTSSSFLHAVIYNSCPPTLRDVLNLRLCCQRRRFPIQLYAKHPYAPLYALGNTLSCPPHPLRTASSGFPNMICSGNCLRPLWLSATARRDLLVRNVVPTLSRPVISWPRLYVDIRCSVGLRC